MSAFLVGATWCFQAETGVGGSSMGFSLHCFPLWKQRGVAFPNLAFFFLFFDFFDFLIFSCRIGLFSFFQNFLSLFSRVQAGQKQIFF